MTNTILSILLLPCMLFGSIEKHFKKMGSKEGNHSMPGIDFIYMINLDSRPEKYARSMKALEPYEIFPCRFSAVNGWKLSFEAIDEIGTPYIPGTPHGPIASVYRHVDGKEYHSFEIMKEPGVSYFVHSLSRGAIGCMMSHLSILKDAYDSGFQTIWIIEDDIQVAANPHELSFLIRELDSAAPDWDILFTDNEIKNAQGQPIPCMVTRPRPNFQIEPLEYYLQRRQVSPNITKIGMRFGSASMIIRRSGMKKLLDYLNTYHIYFPYDIEYFVCPGIQLYACNRDIVTNIAGGVSDTSSPVETDSPKSKQ
jgi:GR25 family glycosyltransferase involved in LPS biosynthesis